MQESIPKNCPEARFQPVIHVYLV